MAGPYRLVVAPPAERDLEALRRRPPNPDLLPRINAAILALETEPRPEGSRKLKGAENHWRIAVGDYRVMYEVSDAERVVTIVRAEHRRDVYRGL